MQVTDEERRRRLNIFRVVVFLILGIFVLRLGYLQILRGNLYSQKAEAQAIKEVTVEPFRGNFFDRNGEIIVHNSPSFSVTITPNEFEQTALPLLASILRIDTAEIRKQIDAAMKISKVKPFRILRDADFEIISAIEERAESLPGVAISNESKRLYSTSANMAHILGFTREISEEMLKQLGDYYNPGDRVGHMGIERAYESNIRGLKGRQFVAVSSTGVPVDRFMDGKSDVPAEEGNDLYLGIDRKLQELAETVMEGKAGAVVAIDPRNGEVLCLVSKPDFDVRAFAGKTPKEEMRKLMTDEGKPVFNRATSTNYPPGSTWKMLIGLAALQEGLITPTTTIYCPGGFTYGGRTWGCHGSHGSTNLRRAVHASCNVFFNKLGLDLGIRKFTRYGRMFGFGEKTYIDIAEERAGLLPSLEYYTRRKVTQNEIGGRLVNLGIGQGELGVSPLQMAVYCAALANGGTIYQPHLVKSVYNRKLREKFTLQTGSRSLDTLIRKEYFHLIQDAMFDVVNVPGGTAAAARLSDVAVCGKTGTAQNPHGKDHAWFICFAPRENPVIAMCVMVENSGFGGAVAAPIAQKLLQQYFHPSSLDSLKRADSLKRLYRPTVVTNAEPQHGTRD